MDNILWWKWKSEFLFKVLHDVYHMDKEFHHVTWHPIFELTGTSHVPTDIPTQNQLIKDLLLCWNQWVDLSLQHRYATRMV